ncbi:small integral membrane protein 8 isoform X2 [Fundulus heteroclitus]|uniref:small integral membrane protein 8 isoform X2 n=1 Tax=Fundulus heteroclitus TaxID=8078 RepID=UPI00165C4358|nr:small integral membrane protein 8 isoform X2 [Fundulus heteroclitus]
MQLDNIKNTRRRAEGNVSQFAGAMLEKTADKGKATAEEKGFRTPGLRGAQTTTLFRAVNPELFIKPAEVVECVDSIRFLSIRISSDLSWTASTSHLVKKAQQWLFFLRKLKRINQ